MRQALDRDAIMGMLGGALGQMSDRRRGLMSPKLKECKDGSVFKQGVICGQRINYRVKDRMVLTKMSTEIKYVDIENGKEVIKVKVFRAVGIANCHPDDIYSERVGVRKALQKAAATLERDVREFVFKENLESLSGFVKTVGHEADAMLAALPAQRAKKHAKIAERKRVQELQKEAKLRVVKEDTAVDPATLVN